MVVCTDAEAAAESDCESSNEMNTPGFGSSTALYGTDFGNSSGIEVDIGVVFNVDKESWIGGDKDADSDNNCLSKSFIKAGL